MFKLIFIALIATITVGCKSESNDNSGPVTFNIQGATSFASNSSNEVFMINEEHEEQDVSDARVTNFKTFPEYVIFEVNYSDYYRVYRDGKQEKMPFNTMPIHMNSERDLVFSDVSVFRHKTQEIEDFKSNLVSPYVQYASGNQIVIFSSSNWQLVDTVTNFRANINNCNGGLTSLSATRAIVNDCSEDVVFDLLGNYRDPLSERLALNNEAVYEQDNFGSLILSQTSSQSSVFLVDELGVARKLFGELTVSASGCMSCVYANNSNLFSSEHWIVVKELNRVSYYHRASGSVNYLLEGINVISISLSDDLLYFIGEDNYGNAHVGKVDLYSESISSSTSINNLTHIEAF